MKWVLLIIEAARRWLARREARHVAQAEESAAEVQRSIERVRLLEKRRAALQASAAELEEELRRRGEKI